MNTTYPVLATTGAVHSKWIEYGQGVPLSEWDQKLWAAVESALDAGLFYNSEVFDFVLKRVPVSAADLLIERGRVERGSFGMEVYNCRHAIQAKRETARRMEAAKEFSVGQVVRSVFVANARVSTLIIDSISPDGFISFHGKKRGSPREWVGSCSASTLSQEMKNKAALRALPASRVTIAA